MTASGTGGTPGRWSEAAALLSLAALSIATPIAASSDEFAPPATKLLLTRTLVRPLPDGNAIATRRTYEVQITRDGDGYRVDGKLTEAAVDVPPSLADLAEIERRRPDLGMFPIMLDARGMMIGGGAVQTGAAADRAARVAAEHIGQSGLPAIDMLQLQAFVAQVSARAPRSQWPADIFHPTVGRHSEQRMIPLPGGIEGKVTIEIAASGSGSGGQLASVERVVTTDLSGDRRVTREQWQLFRNAAPVAR